MNPSESAEKQNPDRRTRLRGITAEPPFFPGDFAPNRHSCTAKEQGTRMDDSQVKDIILNAVAKAAKVSKDDLSDSTKIGAGGLGLDSIATLELLLTIEAEADRRLRIETLTGDDLATVGGLIQFIRSL